MSGGYCPTAFDMKGGFCIARFDMPKCIGMNCPTIGESQEKDLLPTGGKEE